jgi:peroxiredoxin-like protein
MKDLRFDIDLRWSGSGRDGVGEIRADNVSIDLSAPESMGGRGVGTNPEELLVSAVSSCYTATLFGVLRRARLPVASLAVDASGGVTGFPGKARFDRLAVSPTILGGDPSRQDEYEAAAVLAHDRCLIGNTLAPDVTYEVSSVRVQEEATLAPAGLDARLTNGDKVVAPDDVDDGLPAWRSSE